MPTPLIAEEEGPPTLEELDPEVICTGLFPHLESHGWAGFDHLLAQSALPSCPARHTPGPSIATPGVFSSTG
jgi:hypothetical protein